MKVGDLVKWRFREADGSWEVGIIVEGPKPSGMIKVADLCRSRAGDADWWEQCSWLMHSEI